MEGDGIIYVYQIQDPYNLLKKIDIGQFFESESMNAGMKGVSFLNADVLMVITGVGGIYFVSFKSVQFIAHSKIENSNHLNHAAVLRDITAYLVTHGKT